MTKVKIIERKITEVETEYNYPIYLYFQDEDCHDELVMVEEGFQLKVKHDYYGFSIVKGLGFSIEKHILENNLTTKEHFLEVLEDAISSLRESAVGKSKLTENIKIHISQLIMEIELNTNNLSPLRHSNSFLKLKKFTNDEFHEKYDIAEEFKTLFDTDESKT